MADNYLENKFEEFRNKTVARKPAVSLGTLLRRNRSYRGFDKSSPVTQAQLRRIAEVCTLVPSGRNQQVLRLKLLTRNTGADQMQGLYKLGAALPELHLPFPGTEPEAFIIICSTVEPDKWVHMDVGIAAQSMLLKAVEMRRTAQILPRERHPLRPEDCGQRPDPVAFCPRCIASAVSSFPSPS